MCIVQIGENVAGCLMSLKRGMIIFLGGILRVWEILLLIKYDNMDVVILWNVLVDRIPELKDSLIEIKQKM